MSPESMYYNSSFSVLCQIGFNVNSFDWFYYNIAKSNVYGTRSVDLKM